jgi:hypothetical protein
LHRRRSQAGRALIWLGRPTRGGLTLPAPRYFAVIVVGFGYVFERLVAYCIGPPLPLLTQLELFGLGMLFLTTLFWVRRLDRLAEETTYALTNQRLLMAVGPEHGAARFIDAHLDVFGKRETPTDGSHLGP